MTANRNGFTTLDAYVAAEVRADIARKPGASVKGIAERLDMRRATLSSRVNGHAPFSPSLLSAVAAEIGTTASDLVARAERAMERDQDEAAAA